MNPFQPGGIITKETAYCPRPDLETRLREAVDGRERLALLGERSTGKSSLVDVNLRRWGVPYVRVDLMRLASREDLIDRIHRALDHTKEERLQKRAGWAGNVWASARRGLTGKVEAEVPGLKLAVEGAGREDRTSLPGALERIARESRTVNGMVVFFDEFHEIATLPDGEGERVLGVLRGAIQGHRETAYLFAGSNAREMWEMFSNRALPFANTAQTTVVEAIPHADFLRWATGRFTEGGRTLSPQAGLLMLNKGGAEMDALQRIAHAFWAESSPGQVIDEAVAHRALSVVLATYAPFGGALLDRATEAQKRALLGVAVFGGHEAFGSDFLRQTGLTKAGAQKAFAAFTDERSGILEAHRGSVRFRDGLLGEWMASQHDVVKHLFRHVPEREQSQYPALLQVPTVSQIALPLGDETGAALQRWSAWKTEWPNASDTRRREIDELVSRDARFISADGQQSAGIAFRRAARDYVEGKISNADLQRYLGRLNRGGNDPTPKPSVGLKP